MLLSQVATVTPLEVRRYLRHAGAIIAAGDEAPAEQQVLLLRRARHCISAALCGVERLLLGADGVPDSIEDPLTEPHRIDSIGEPP